MILRSASLYAVTAGSSAGSSLSNQPLDAAEVWRLRRKDEGAENRAVAAAANSDLIVPCPSMETSIERKPRKKCKQKLNLSSSTREPPNDHANKRLSCGGRLCSRGVAHDKCTRKNARCFLTARLLYPTIFNFLSSSSHAQVVRAIITVRAVTWLSQLLLHFYLSLLLFILHLMTF